MSMTRSYAKSPAPAFDAVADIQFYLGDKYARVRDIVKEIKDCEQFAIACSFVGIQGFPVKAWYEHFNGGNTWKEKDHE